MSSYEPVYGDEWTRGSRGYQGDDSFPLGEDVAEGLRLSIGIAVLVADFLYVALRTRHRRP